MHKYRSTTFPGRSRAEIFEKRFDSELMGTVNRSKILDRGLAPGG
jgi:hypothetical protein